MASSVVFKVKYGDTLRRFNVLVDEDLPLYLDMEGLRTKVRGFFNFSPDAALTMTYVDEDQDVVTIGDSEDLYDVIRQGLNPVRINVQLIDDTGSSSFARSSGGSTPRTPASEGQAAPSAVPIGVAQVLKSVPDYQSAIQNGISGVLKSVPEPLRVALSKASLDVASKATSSSPLLVELIESFIKSVNATYVNANVSPFAQNAATDVSSPMDASPNDASLVKRASGFGVQDPMKIPEFVGNSVTSPAPGDTVTPKVIFEAGESKSPSGDDKRKGKEIRHEPIVESAGFSDSTNLPADNTAGFTPHVKNKQLSNDDVSSSPFNQCSDKGMPPVTPSELLPSAQLPYHPRGMIFHRGVRCDDCGMFPITGPRFKSKVKENYDLCYVCLLRVGSANERDYIRIDFPAPHYNQWYSGICDATNPPFWGRPPRGPPFLKHDLMRKSMKPARSEDLHCKKMEPNRLRLDSRFIADVNVLDGTIMAPKTPFTKIWRLRNSGKYSWPQGTQLLWIGGDKFSDVDAVEVKLPLQGLPVDSELEVAADFTAPELPGRYVSYWRMASPSGQKFGQRVWVLILVDATLADLAFNNGLNLNYPPAFDSVQDDSLVAAAKGEPLLNVNSDPVNPLPSKNSENPLLASGPIPKVEDLNLPSVPLYPPIFPSEVLVSLPGPISPMNNQVPAAFSYPPNISEMFGSAPAINPLPPSLYPPVDTVVPGIGPDFTPLAASCPPAETVLGNASPAIPPAASDTSANSPESPAAVPVNVGDASGQSKDWGKESNVEEVLLKELEEMGFIQVDLNKEILRLNKFDLERSVEDLCGYADSEWDPLLVELREMGFLDKETNKRLLVKNNGSLKRVVMDLIAGQTD